MTNEEAREILTDHYEYDDESVLNKAIDLAVKALEKIDKLESVRELFCEDYTIAVRNILFGDINDE